MKTDRFSGNFPGFIVNRRVFTLTLAGLMLLAIYPAPLSADSRARRDAELGSLPPPPDLRPDSQKSWFERRTERREAEQRARAEKAADKAKITAARNAPKEETSAQRLKRIQNSRVPQPPRRISGDPEFMTPSGYRLRSFNEPQFWEGEAAPHVEEHIASLPPMPDLRSNSQKSWGERRRERQAEVQRIKNEKARIIAEREEQRRLGEEVARQKALEAANRPPPPQRNYATYGGEPIQPETPTGHGLKAFGQKSRYIRDNQVVYQGQAQKRVGLRKVELPSNSQQP